jgi:PKD repeat protein
LALSAVSYAGTAFKATTTLTDETSNNTSTADSFTAQVNGNNGASNISKLPIRSLMYAGSNAKVYVHLMPWFGFGDHMNIGYTSNNPAQVQRQVTDMISRGVDGAIIDWYGQGKFNSHFVFYNQATQDFMNETQLHAGFQFAIMDDAGSLKTCNATAGCDITQALIDDLTYAYNNYETSPSYLRYNNRPVVYFFGHEAYALDWARVRASVPGNPLFIFRNTGGFGYAESNGAFSWVAPETVSSTNPMALLYLDSFDKAVLSHTTAYTNGSAYKGFNDTLALWTANRIINQQCGQTWLASFAESSKYFSAATQMMGIQLVTWNDYEEATEIESGIDNCVTVTASATGTTASWNVTGQLNTIDHFSVYISQDGQNLMWLADAPATATSLNLAPFSLNAGGYTLFVKAVGKPTLTNKMSAGVPVTITNQPPVAVLAVSASSTIAPVTVTASTAGSSDADGTISSTVINFGDGSAAVSAASASHVYSTAGSYTITATVTDNLGASASASRIVTVPVSNKPPVALLSVTPNSATAPATVRASTAGSSDPDGTIAATVIQFGDGTATVSAASATHVYSAPGTYTVTATVTDNQGASSSASATVVVAAPNKPPVAAVAVSATSAYGPATISASTAGSSDPDGTVVSSTIHFGDGSSASGPSATHSYSAAGVYTITALVTDNQGASSTATTSVTVKAPEVIVSSPANGTSVVAPAHFVASGFSGNPVTSMQIYVDGVMVSHVASANLDVNQAIASGTHGVVIKGWDTAGRSFSKALNITVLAANQPPVAALSTSASTVMVGGAITASTAGSSDPDGSIVATTIDFGDGVSVAGSSASHQYKAAGTYTVRATVTDNQGATSSTTRTVIVQKQFVSVASPTGGTLTTSSAQVSAAGHSGYPVTATQIYLDGVLKYQTAASAVNTSISVSTGTHSIVVQSWDASGATFKSSPVSVTR